MWSIQYSVVDDEIHYCSPIHVLSQSSTWNMSRLRYYHHPIKNCSVKDMIELLCCPDGSLPIKNVGSGEVGFSFSKHLDNLKKFPKNSAAGHFGAILGKPPTKWLEGFTAEFIRLIVDDDQHDVLLVAPDAESDINTPGWVTLQNFCYNIFAEIHTVTWWGGPCRPVNKLVSPQLRYPIRRGIPCRILVFCGA